MVSLLVTTGLQEALIPLATTQKLCTGSSALSPWWPLNVSDSGGSPGLGDYCPKHVPSSSPGDMHLDTVSALACLKYL